MKKILFIILFFVLFACNDSNKGAQQLLDEAKDLLAQGKYAETEVMIDSIRKAYPRAVEQIKEGVALRKDTRVAKNKAEIALCDSLIPLEEMRVDSLKSLFIFNQNKEYQTKGLFFPKNTPITINSTYFRSSVSEDGEVYLESIFVGGGKHDRVMLTSDGENIESLPIKGDGFNYRFSTLGKEYEVLTMIPPTQNGMVDFVVKYVDKPIKITLKGNRATSYNLTSRQKADIVLSQKLSQAIQRRDSLMTVKDKATILLNYVVQQKGTTSDSE